MGCVMIGQGLMKFGGGGEFLRALGGMPPLIPENETFRLCLGALAAAFEVLGGLGVALGIRFKTSCALIVLVMIPAFTYHVANITGFRSLMTNTWPVEIAFVFFALMFIGPGEKTMRFGR